MVRPIDEIVFTIENISKLDDALEAIEMIKDYSKDSLSEYPEATNYIEAIGAYLPTYANNFRELQSDELSAFCMILLGGLQTE